MPVLGQSNCIRALPIATATATATARRSYHLIQANPAKQSSKAHSQARHRLAARIVRSIVTEVGNTRFDTDGHSKSVRRDCMVAGILPCAVEKVSLISGGVVYRPAVLSSTGCRGEDKFA